MAKDQPRIPKGFVGAGRFMKVGQVLVALKDAAHPGDGKKNREPKLAKAGAKLYQTDTGAKITSEEAGRRMFGDVGYAAKTAKAPKVKTLEDLARERHARVDRARTTADMAAEVEELVYNETDPDVIRRRVRALAKRHQIESPGQDHSHLPTIAEDIAKQDDVSQMLAVAHAHADSAGVRRGGAAGAIEPFDRTKHKPIGNAGLEAGQQVEVVRPGYTFTDHDGSQLTLSKAVVDETLPAAQPAPDTPAAGAVTIGSAHPSGLAGRLAAMAEPGDVTGRRAIAAAPIGLHTAGAITRLTKDQFDMLRQYKGTLYPNVNGVLRRFNGDPPGGFGTEYEREAVGHIDAVMDRSKLSTDVVLHRGVKDGHKVFGAAFDRDMTGAEWTEHAYLSTTADPKVATDREFFASDGGAVLRIRAPKGTGAVALSDDKYESEMLLQRGMRMRVLSDTGPGPDRVIEVGIVHDDTGRAAARRAETRAGGDGPAVDGLPGRGDAPGRPAAGGPVAKPPRLAKAGARLSAPPPAADVAAKLRAATSRKEGAAYLSSLNLSKADLVKLSRALGVPPNSRDNKAGVQAGLVNILVGRRLDGEAIYRVAGGR